MHVHGTLCTPCDVCVCMYVCMQCAWYVCTWVSGGCLSRITASWCLYCMRVEYTMRRMYVCARVLCDAFAAIYTEGAWVDRIRASWMMSPVCVFVYVCVLYIRCDVCMCVHVCSAYYDMPYICLHVDGCVEATWVNGAPMSRYLNCTSNGSAFWPD